MCISPEMAENNSWLKKGSFDSTKRLTILRPNDSGFNDVADKKNGIVFPPARKSILVNTKRTQMQLPKEKKNDQTYNTTAKKATSNVTSLRKSLIPCRPSLMQVNSQPVSSARQPLRQLPRNNVTLKYSTPRSDLRGILSASKRGDFGSAQLKNVSFENLQVSVIEPIARVDASTNTEIPFLDIEARGDGPNVNSPEISKAMSEFSSDIRGLLQRFEQFALQFNAQSAPNPSISTKLADIPETSENPTPVLSDPKGPAPDIAETVDLQWAFNNASQWIEMETNAILDALHDIPKARSDKDSIQLDENVTSTDIVRRSERLKTRTDKPNREQSKLIKPNKGRKN